MTNYLRTQNCRANKVSQCRLRRAKHDCAPPTITRIWRFVSVQTLYEHNGRYFIQTSFIFGMQTILLGDKQL